MLEIAVYHPQIPQNTGTLLRVSSCLGVHVNIIGPMAFVFDDTKFKRAGMDYISTASYSIYTSFKDFLEEKLGRRLIALEINDKATAHTKFEFSANDIILVGSEHSGFENGDLEIMDECVIIPMKKDRRSMNMAIATTFALSEAMRQLNMFDSL